MAFLAELRVCNFTAILEAGDDYAVKEWAEGITGVEWFRMWEAQGAKTADESFRKLIQLFYQIAEKKIYLQNFKPHNLLWDQKQQIWHVRTSSHLREPGSIEPKGDRLRRAQSDEQLRGCTKILLQI